MDIEEYIAANLNGETLTKDAVKECLRNYVYLTAAPSEKDKLVMYERLMEDLTEAYVLGHEEVLKQLLANIADWRHVRQPHRVGGYEKHRIELNKTFFNLRNTQQS
jgi:hypothetical protein